MSSLAVFGEITSSNGESKYAWANAVTMTLLSKLEDVEGFENVQAHDIVNAGLVFLNLFFNLHVDVKNVDENLHAIYEMCADKKEFEDFLKIAIHHGRMHNIMFNDGLYFEGDENGF